MDHLNLLKSFGLFVGKIKKGGKLLLRKGIDLPLSDSQLTDLDILSYSLDSEADFFARNIVLNEGLYDFDLVIPGGLMEGLRLSMPGKINIENAIAAASMAWILGIPEEIIRESLFDFRGIQRRFDIRFIRPDFVYIDDYAHHPVEIKSFLQSVKQLFPKKKITGVFQPHLFSRTRDLFLDFAKSLDSLDELILLDIYPAREKEIAGISSEMILDEVGISRKAIMNKDQVLDYVHEIHADVLLTMGAGDIDELAEPIVRILENRETGD
jgi:UDP-N-acetylmuramate--alanine ligase